MANKHLPKGKSGFPLVKKTNYKAGVDTVVCLDTETRDAKNPKYDGLQELVVGVANIYKVDIYTGIAICKIDTFIWHHPNEFQAKLVSLGNCVIVAHNMDFDADVLQLGSPTMADNYGYTFKPNKSIFPPIVSGFPPFMMVYEYTDIYGEIVSTKTYIDNTNYNKAPLADIGETYGIPKGIMPLEKDYNDYNSYLADLTAYCKQDVEILSKSYFSWFDFTNKVAGIRPGITIPSTAMRMLQSRFLRSDMSDDDIAVMPKIIGTHHYPNILYLEQQSYIGGRTDAFYRGKPPSGTKLYKYDFNSDYVFIMHDKLPISYAKKGSRNDAKKRGDKYIRLAHVTLNISETSEYWTLGLEGVKVPNKGLVFPCGEFETLLWEPMLDLAFELGYVKEVHSVYLYESEAILHDYMSFMYSKRLESKQVGNTIESNQYKLMGNSVYGKFGQKDKGKWVECDDDETFYNAGLVGHRLGMYKSGEVTAYFGHGGKVYKYIQELGIPDKGSVPSIAGFVTSAARAMLHRAMMRVIDNGGMVYYCDTDSIITDKPLPDDMVSDTELGKLKLEGVSDADDCHFYAPKDNEFDGKRTLKGIQNAKVGVQEYDQPRFSKFRTRMRSLDNSIRELMSYGPTVTMIHKSVSSVNNKRRVVGENRPTYPLDYQELFIVDDDS